MAPPPLLKPHTLKSNHLTPGDCVSADHYFSPVPGCLPHTFGKECVGYTCSSLFVDHASGKIFNFPQYSNNASKTIQYAQHLESMARDEGFRIKAYHSDNGIFVAADFQEHCKQQQQKFSFSGVGAKHQNGIAE
jgi:transposase InsO family protein